MKWIERAQRFRMPREGNRQGAFRECALAVGKRLSGKTFETDDDQLSRGSSLQKFEYSTCITAIALWLSSR